jgi:hypothetical protein
MASVVEGDNDTRGGGERVARTSEGRAWRGARSRDQGWQRREGM